MTVPVAMDTRLVPPATHRSRDTLPSKEDTHLRDTLHSKDTHLRDTLPSKRTMRRKTRGSCPP